VRPDLIEQPAGPIGCPGRLDAAVERLKTIFEVERGMEEAIARDAPVQEIVAIPAEKRPKP
jgi:hypothetical protein